jgi:serine/threonine protein kinase
MVLARQVVDALNHLHVHKVVHGDVKLDSFLVQPAVGSEAATGTPPRVVLSDFGCTVLHGPGPADMDDAFEVHATEATNIVLGNPAHLAPEVHAALKRKMRLARGSTERVVIPLAAQDAFAAGLVLCVLSLGTLFTSTFNGNVWGQIVMGAVFVAELTSWRRQWRALHDYLLALPAVVASAT